VLVLTYPEPRQLVRWPLEVARADAVALGLAANDKFELISVGTGVARVRTQHGAVSYMLDLVQPVRLGQMGIWMVAKVARAPNG